MLSEVRNEVQGRAIEYFDAGFFAFPVSTGGGKIPLVKRWQDRRDRGEVEELFGRWDCGIGLPQGIPTKSQPASEVIDIDDAETFAPYCDAVEQVAPGLVDKLTIIRTPRPGFHLHYRCGEVEGNQKLARSAEGGTIIETRGRGGYVLAPGSPAACHLTGRTYEHESGPPLTDLPVITAEEREILFSVARSFDEAPELAPEPKASTYEASGEDRPESLGELPGTVFNRIGDITPYLEEEGYPLMRYSGGVAHHKRPGKEDNGSSLTVGKVSQNGNQLVCNFSSNSPHFDAPPAGKVCSTTTYFQALANLKFSGDLAATSAFLEEQGFGGPPGCHPDVDLSGISRQLREFIISYQKKYPPNTADEIAWGEIDMWEREKLPEFPVDALPRLLRGWVEAVSDALETPEGMAAMFGLAACSAGLSRHTRVQATSTWTEPTNLFVTTVLESGEKKSPVYKLAVEPIKIRETEVRLEYDKAKKSGERRAKVHEKRITELEKLYAKQDDEEKRKKIMEQIDEEAEKSIECEVPPRPSLWLRNSTVEHMAMTMDNNGGYVAVISDEGGVFDLMLGKFKGEPDYEILLQGYSGGDYRDGRMTRKDTEVEASVMTCAFATQPAHFEHIAKSGGTDERGLLGRFLYSFADYREKHFEDKPIPESILKGYRNLVLSLYNPRGDTGTTFKLSPEAYSTHKEFRREMEERKKKGSGDLYYIRTWCAKAAGHAVRVAAILHAIEQADDLNSSATVISNGTMKDALRIMRYCIPHTERAYSLADQDERDFRKSDAVLKNIQAGIRDGKLDCFTAGDLLSRVRKAIGSTKLDVLEQILAGMCERNMLAKLAPLPGKRVFRYVPNLAILDLETT